MVEELVATSPDDNTLILKWVMPAFFDQDILNYAVSIRPITSLYNDRLSVSRNMTAELHIQDTTLLATRLNEGIPYNISVIAVNSAGDGEIKSSIYFTRELDPNAAPQNITAVWSSSMSIKVTWTHLTLYEGRGHIITYTISYTSMTNGLVQQLILSVGSARTTTDVELTGLQRSTTYLVQIWASTIAGPGPTSPAIIIPPPLSSSMWTGQAISAITGGVVAAVFLITVAAVAIAIIVKKYQQPMKSFQHKDEKKTVELKCIRGQDELDTTEGIATTDEVVYKTSPKLHSHQYENIHLDKKNKSLKGKSLQPSTTEGHNHGYCTPMAETSYYETINPKT